MAKMSDKTKRAINKGRRRAGLKPIKFGAKKKNNPHKKLFKRNGLAVMQVPIGYKIGDRAAQVRLMKRFIRKANKAKKEELFEKMQRELDG